MMGKSNHDILSRGNKEENIINKSITSKYKQLYKTQKIRYYKKQKIFEKLISGVKVNSNNKASLKEA